MVRISGGVERPAVYELKGDENLEDLLYFAQGFTYFADEKNIVLEMSFFGCFSSPEI